MRLEGRPELEKRIKEQYPLGYESAKLIEKGYLTEKFGWKRFFRKDKVFVYSEELEEFSRISQEAIELVADENGNDKRNIPLENLINYDVKKYEGIRCETNIILDRLMHDSNQSLYGLMNWDAPIQKREDVLREKYEVVKEEGGLEDKLGKDQLIDDVDQVRAFSGLTGLTFLTSGFLYVLSSYAPQDVKTILEVASGVYTAGGIYCLRETYNRAENIVKGLIKGDYKDGA